MKKIIFLISASQCLSETKKLNLTEINLLYSSDAINWLIDDNLSSIDMSKIIEKYEKINNYGEKINIYDQKQKVLITIEFQNDQFIITDIKSEVADVY